jgi:hypothetical protein
MFLQELSFFVITNVYVLTAIMLPTCVGSIVKPLKSQHNKDQVTDLRASLYSKMASVLLPASPAVLAIL